MTNPLEQYHQAQKEQEKRPLISRTDDNAIIRNETPETPEQSLFRIAGKAAADPSLSPGQRRQVVWEAMQENPPSMPPQRLARFGDDPARMGAAMDGLMHLATDPNRANQDPQQLTHLWANGMAGNPGQFERDNPPPPRRTWGQTVGYETDFHGDQRQYPLMDGLRADWHDLSADVGETLGKAADNLGYDQVAETLEADARRNRAMINPLRDQYKYDPNATAAWQTGYYGRSVAKTANQIATAKKIWDWLRRR